MSAELLDKLTDALAEQVVEKVGPKLVKYFEDRRLPNFNPLLKVSEVAKQLRVSQTTVRQLINAGALKKARGMSDIRIRQSVLDKYGTSK